MQTSLSDIQSGWRTFRAWTKRFRSSVEVFTDNPLHKVYLADALDLGELYLAAAPSTEEVEKKIAFMQAYFEALAIECNSFNESVKKLLKFQSRLCAPHLYGFWFFQTDICKFGAGASPSFLGDHANIFCEDAGQIDFSDITVIIPHNLIVVRRPTGNWTNAAVQNLLKRIRADLDFDGLGTKFGVKTIADILYLTPSTPYFGLGDRPALT